MNELVYLNDQNYVDIRSAIDFAISVTTNEKLAERMRLTAAKLDYAYDNGLLMSFDVKKVKVRRVLRW